MKKVFAEFKERLSELYYLGSTQAFLQWDQEVFMPEGSANFRAETVSRLAGIIHKKFTSRDFEIILKKLKKNLDNKKLNDREVCIVREIWREFKRAKKLPLKFVEDLARTTSEARNIWALARKKSDFKLFLPHLKKIIEFKRKEAKLVGYKKSPYDALLDSFEPGMTAERMSEILNDLKKFLIPFLGKIRKSKIKINPRILKGNFSAEKQKKLNRKIAEKIGFNFKTGRLDESTHPFTMGFHPEDVRITTRFEKDDFFYSLDSTIHETGHALYEQGLLSEHFGTPLGESISLGIHESQSRIWEKNVGKSRPFWKYFFSLLKKEFPKPFSRMDFERFYQAINFVKPGLIRTEADEVTYNFHIILRFEIEKNLIEGSIEVEDLPAIWKEKMKEYLGVSVPNNALGVLQDVHWSGGSVGYFPTYSLGNLYAAQFFAVAKKEITNLEKEIALGHFEHLREWLRKNIHIHGKYFSADDLTKEVTGEKLNSRYFIEYITKKYSEIYKLKL